MASDSGAAGVLITGGTGFIGRVLVAALLREGRPVRVVTRDPERARRLWPKGSVRLLEADLTRAGPPAALCRGTGTVYHLAGVVPGRPEEGSGWMSEGTPDTGTGALLAAAAESGVDRFVYFSSVKAMGEGGEACLDETSPALPETPYGRAKLADEGLVVAAAADHGMHACVLRLPVVYGRDNRGNIPRMIEAVDRGRFPPLPEVHNRRSMVHVDDVVRAALLATGSEAASGKVYLVTDGEVYSGRRIYAAICEALGRAPPRRSVPVGLLRAGAAAGEFASRVTGRPMPLNRAVLRKLLGSAWYSSGRIVCELGFRPSRTLEDALPEMVAVYRGRA